MNPAMHNTAFHFKSYIINNLILDLSFGLFFFIFIFISFQSWSTRLQTWVTSSTI